MPRRRALPERYKSSLRERSLSVRQSDVSRHAKVIARAQAQKTIGRARLRHCTLYTNIDRARCAPTALARPRSAGWSMRSVRRSWAASRNGIFYVTATCPAACRRYSAKSEIVSGVRVHDAQQAWRDRSPVTLAHDQAARLADASGRARLPVSAGSPARPGTRALDGSLVHCKKARQPIPEGPAAMMLDEPQWLFNALQPFGIEVTITVVNVS